MMLITITGIIFKMTPEDLKLRKNYIGGSDAPVIMEVSPWTTPYELWQNKLGLIPDFEGNEYTQEGIRKEPIARREFEKLTGLMMFPERRFSKEFEFMMATLDGISLDGKYAVEIKCPGEVDHEKALNNIVPEKYYAQLQHQICVLGLPMIFYFSFNGKENKLIEVPRDDAYISTLTGKEAKFFEMIKNLNPPELSPRDFNKRDDTKWLEKAVQWQKIQDELHAIQEAEKNLRQELIELSDGKSTIGGGVRLTKVIRKGNVDYTAIPGINELNLEVYRKEPIQSWRLSKA